MKIGILTFHCAHNHGAVLQCYALQETLKSMGHDVEVINYRPDYLVAPFKPLVWMKNLSLKPWRFAYSILIELLRLHQRYLKYNKFEQAIAKLLTLTPVVSQDDIPSYYDAIIFGSDQIWNPRLTNGFDNTYFGGLNFPKLKQKYIAYAASSGVAELNSEQKSYIQQQLKNFDSISVREKILKDILCEIGYESEVVVDPTFLLPFDKWKEIATMPQRNRPYVLTYEMATDSNVRRIADNLALQLGADVICLTGFFTNKFDKYQCTSPDEFIGLFMNAACVVTTSFHGTAFSVICKRPFYNLRQGTPIDFRAENLLASIGLSDRMIDKHATPVFQDIDYQIPSKKISELSESSKLFINHAITGENA